MNDTKPANLLTAKSIQNRSSKRDVSIRDTASAKKRITSEKKINSEKKVKTQNSNSARTIPNKILTQEYSNSEYNIKPWQQVKKEKKDSLMRSVEINARKSRNLKEALIGTNTPKDTSLITPKRNSLITPKQPKENPRTTSSFDLQMNQDSPPIAKLEVSPDLTINANTTDRSDPLPEYIQSMELVASSHGNSKNDATSRR